VPEFGRFVAGGGHRDPHAAERVQGQALAGLAVGAGALIDGALVVEGKESLDWADDFAAGGFGLEHLVEEAKEGAAHAEDPVAAVGALVGLGEQARGEEGSQEQFQVAEALWAEWAEPAAQGGQPGSESGKERRMHDKYTYVSGLDGKRKMLP
jgi:hypothetical protein